jgi:hypothetical protein
MKVEVDLTLLRTLVECIEKQADLANQDTATQARWRGVINETYLTAKAAVDKFDKENMVNGGRTETGMGPILNTNTQFL